MSLIDEALRRAQEESVRRGEGKGTQRWVAGPPPRRRTGPGLVVAVVAAGLVAGLALGAWLFRGRGGSLAGVAPVPQSAVAEEATSKPSAPEPPAGAAPADAAPVDAMPVAVTPPAESGAEAAPSDRRAAPGLPESPAPSVPPAAVEPVRPAPAATAPAATPGSAPAAVEPGPPPESPTGAATAAPSPVPEAEPAEERTFRRIAQLPDGTTLSLNGIAFSEERPMALLNGQVVAVGETVAGYRVAEILHDRVRLEREGAAVVLRLK